jgi:hypothetical protein
MKSVAADGATPEMFADMMKSWGPMSEAGLTMWRQMLEGMSGAGGKGGGGSAGR